MLKRMVIELAVVFSLLLVCVIYGAVTVRDAQNAHNPGINVSASSQNSVIPQQSNQPGVNQDGQGTISSGATPDSGIRTDGSSKGAGDSFSNRVSRFFLAGVSLVAGVFEGIVQLFL